MHRFQVSGLKFQVCRLRQALNTQFQAAETLNFEPET